MASVREPHVAAEVELRVPTPGRVESFDAAVTLVLDRVARSDIAHIAHIAQT